MALSDEDLEKIRKIVREAIAENSQASKAEIIRAQTRARVRKLREGKGRRNASVTQKSVTQEGNGNGAVTRRNGHKKIEFDEGSGAFIGITEEQELRWQEAYPAVPIPPAIARAAVWAAANPANRKSNWHRFLASWFQRDQDKAGRVRQ